MFTDLVEDTQCVKNETENSENNSDNERTGPSDKPEYGYPPQPKYSIGPSGSPNELEAIRAALKGIISESAFTRQSVAIHLRLFFGPDHDDVGRSLFLKWAADQLPTDVDAVPEEELVGTWLQEGAGDAQPTIALPKLLELLHRNARGASTDAIAWPETAGTGSHLPRQRSQKNIAWLLHSIGAAVYRNEFSGRNYIEGYERFDELDDLAMEALYLRGDRMGLQPPIEYFGSVVRELARQNARNPVKDYFRAVEWDKKPRLDSWLIDYAGAEDTKLNREFGKLWLIAAVRRVRRPGTKFDQILVLEGEQGAGKSSLARILANAVGPGLFEDGLQLGVDPKQVIELTRSKLIVEISELRGNNRDVEAVKAMLSRIEDSARLAYARDTSRVPRQFVMMGTTNSSEYLVDSTGNRRIWPVKVGRIDLEALTNDAPQLWAEAAFYEARNTSIELPRDLWTDASSEQSERVVGDPIYDLIASHLGEDGGEVNMDALFTMVGFDKTKIDRRNRATQTAIGRAMSQIPGWQRVRRWNGGQRIYVYKKEAAPEREFVWYADEPDGEIKMSPLSLGSGPERLIPFSAANRRSVQTVIPTGPTSVPTKID